MEDTYSKEEGTYERMKITIGNYTFHIPLGKLRLNEFVLKKQIIKKTEQIHKTVGI